LVDRQLARELRQRFRPPTVVETEADLLALDLGEDTPASVADDLDRRPCRNQDVSGVVEVADPVARSVQVAAGEASEYWLLVVRAYRAFDLERRQATVGDREGGGPIRRARPGRRPGRVGLRFSNLRRLGLRRRLRRWLRGRWLRFLVRALRLRCRRWS